MSISRRDAARDAPGARRAPKAATRATATALLLLYAALILAPLGIALLLGERGHDPLTYVLGLNTAIVGFAVLTMQFVLAARLKSADRPFGLDMVYQFHRAMGVFAGLLLLAHPLLLAAGGRGWPLLIGLHQKWFIWVGRGALLVLLFLAAQAALRSRLRLEYRKWQAAHGALAAAVLAAALVHVWNAGGDSKLGAMRAAWLLLCGAAALAYLWRRVGLPARLRRHAYTVAEVRREAEGVYTVSLAPPPGASVPEYLPGQYQYLTLCRDGLPAEEHPFTLSSSPARRATLSATIKAAGDFTGTVGRTRPGDAALVDAPFGRFSYVLHPDEADLVFLAGGIGVTPLMSMLRHMRDTGARRRVLLLYANRAEADIVFREELDEMARGDAPALTVVQVLSRPGADWAGETGHIDAACLQRHCPDVDGKGFYVCGPAGLISAVTSDLRGLGVPDRRIHFEGFGY